MLIKYYNQTMNLNSNETITELWNSQSAEEYSCTKESWQLATVIYWSI